MGRATCSGRASIGRTPRAPTRPMQPHVSGQHTGGAGAKDSRVPATTTTADLFDIAAPMLQAGGTASGTIFAPDGIELYLDSVAMINAYEIYRWVPTMPCRAGSRWTDSVM